MLITDLAATLTFQELCEEVRTMCSVTRQQPITLKWIDDEGRGRVLPDLRVQDCPSSMVLRRNQVIGAFKTLATIWIQSGTKFLIL